MPETPINASDVPMSPLAAAQKALEADRAQRLEAFRAGLERLAQEYRCEIFAVAQINEDGRIVAIPGARALA